MQSEQPGETRRRGTGLFSLLIGFVVILAIVGAFVLVQRKSQYEALANETEKLAISIVAVAHPIVEGA